MTGHVGRPDGIETLEVFSSEFRILLSAEQSGGSVGIFEERDQPGFGPPLHVHHDADETFVIEEGRFRFRLGDNDLEAGAGTVVFIPRGTPHTFVNAGDGHGRFRCVMTPGGFEGFFAELARRGLSLPDDMEEIGEIGRKFSLEHVGPNPFTGN